MSEHGLWKELRNGLHGVHLCRLESHATAAGFPDVDYCVAGRSGQVELKYAEWPNAPEVRPAQVLWFRTRVRHGGSPLVLAKLVKDGDRYYCLYPGSMARRLAQESTFDAWLELSRRTYMGNVDWRSLISIMKDPVVIY